jgi:hypothetical protein
MPTFWTYPWIEKRREMQMIECDGDRGEQGRRRRRREEEREDKHFTRPFSSAQPSLCGLHKTKKERKKERKTEA